MENEPSFVHEQGERNASIIQIDTGKHVTAVVLCAVVCGACMVFALWASITARNASTDYEVLLNHYIHLQAKYDTLSSDVEELRHGRR